MWSANFWSKSVEEKTPPSPRTPEPLEPELDNEEDDSFLDRPFGWGARYFPKKTPKDIGDVNLTLENLDIKEVSEITDVEVEEHETTESVFSWENTPFGHGTIEWDDQGLDETSENPDVPGPSNWRPNHNDSGFVDSKPRTVGREYDNVEPIVSYNGTESASAYPDQNTHRPVDYGWPVNAIFENEDSEENIDEDQIARQPSPIPPMSDQQIFEQCMKKALAEPIEEPRVVATTADQPRGEIFDIDAYDIACWPPRIPRRDLNDRELTFPLIYYDPEVVFQVPNIDVALEEPHNEID